MKIKDGLIINKTKKIIETNTHAIEIQSSYTKDKKRTTTNVCN